ncbi:TaqI-like C-terminal specificity domain-containing protein, partial [Phocaeicola plebeius]|uniref:TaqI-like C-terminal specificity domain-containing protein n=1 Tax=Phocaeicola plebeius TaxID=310297 RepID=UPI00286FA87B
LANCQTEDERVRTAELIRPILRGRDIRRYGYKWAELWIINIHNGIKGKLPRIKIEDYPAIKAHLDLYWDKISKRTDKGDTPYNLRNCAYMEDFSKPKIVWKIIGNQMAFAYDANNYVMNNACYIMTGDHLDYLLAVLNSQAITWYSYVTNMNKTGVGDVQVGGQNIATFPIPFYDANKIELIELAELANSIINKNINLPFIDSKIEGLVSMIYGFTSEETNFLHSFVSSLRKSI